MRAKVVFQDGSRGCLGKAICECVLSSFPEPFRPFLISPSEENRRELSHESVSMRLTSVRLAVFALDMLAHRRSKV